MRVGTLGVRLVSESSGNTRYISSTVPARLRSETPPLTRIPKKVMWLMLVACVSTKSSADSISKLVAEVPGREALPIRPFGLPVVKENGIALTRPGILSKAAARPRIRRRRPEKVLISRLLHYDRSVLRSELRWLLAECRARKLSDEQRGS